MSPLSKRKFKQVFRSLRAPPFAFARSATIFRASEPIPQYLCPLVPSKSCQSSCTQHSPSLTSAVLSSTQVHHSCLPAPSSALSPPFNTLPALQHVSNLHAILLATCTLLYPFVTVPPSRATQCTRYHHLERLAGFFQSFTSHSPARSQRRIIGCY